jgi:shikimate kinase
MSRLVIITGFMGSGKTAVARELARLSSQEMIDLDQAIAAEEGLTPKEIIEQKSEAVFREVETRVLRSVLENSAGGVIALGGGAFTVEQNRKLISHHEAITIWLDASFETCWERILAAGSERPLARSKTAARLLYDERKPLYALTNLHIAVQGEKSAAEVAAEIVARISEECRGS